MCLVQRHKTYGRSNFLSVFLSTMEYLTEIIIPFVCGRQSLYFLRFIKVWSVVRSRKVNLPIVKKIKCHRKSSILVRWTVVEGKKKK